MTGSKRPGRGRSPRVEAMEARRLLDGGFREFAIPSGFSAPQAIAPAADGSVWFTEYNTGKVGRVARDGSVSEVATGLPNADGIAYGPDGAVWVTAGFGSQIGAGRYEQIARVGPDGQVTRFALDLADNGRLAETVGEIVAGSDGALWFTSETNNAIGRITTGGEVSWFGLPTPLAGVRHIAAGPDGALWFTETSAGQVGRIGTDRAIAEFPAAVGRPGPIVAGADGAVWYAGRAAIGRMTPSGQASVVPIAGPVAGATYSGPDGLALGPDAQIWFTLSAQDDQDQIGRVAADGTVSYRPAPAFGNFVFGAGSEPRAIVTGTDGALWLLELNANRVARYEPPPPDPTPPPPAPAPGSPGGTGTAGSPGAKADGVSHARTIRRDLKAIRHQQALKRAWAAFLKKHPAARRMAAAPHPAG